jgi:Ni,Fe-hydrogenase maturation factor
MKVMNLSPDITFIGIKPKSIEYGDRMSPEIEKRIPDIISLIYIEIDKYLNLYNIPV